MRAARQFVIELGERVADVARIEVALYGSLALTGLGHGTDRAIILGLAGYLPDAIAPEIAQSLPQTVGATGKLRLTPGRQIAFRPETDILFLRGAALARHSNGMRFKAFTATAETIRELEYFSIGGGTVEGEGFANAPPGADIPYRFDSAAELLTLANAHGLALWQVVEANELALGSRSELSAYMASIWRTMQECAARGLRTEGILPGGLNVRRRAPRLYTKYRARSRSDTLIAMDYVSVVAIAVNEENAAGGRVVTAPTNGAAGLIPAVLHYYNGYVPDATPQGIERFLLTAAAVGMLYKRNASISGAEVGCQGEVGVACSMAAAGLVAAMGGSNAQVEHAAEIGMEHNLGMTCDPIGGLVQIPCIERNAVGAVKALNAARMAFDDEGHKVSLDQVIAVMYRTGLDMQTKYKETSLGGLAVGVVEC
jgi:L-serine dehydratase